MKYTVLFTLFAASTAFTPTFTTSFRASTSLSVSRRGMLESASAFSAAVVFAGASPALADGAVSGATKNRARGIYGGRIAALRKAVDAGDFGAVVAEKNAFILFNSGALKGDKDKTSQAISSTNEIFAAIRGQDKAGLKKAYDSYVKAFDINPLPDLVNSNENSQGYSNDYDFRVRTQAAKIYVR